MPLIPLRKPSISRPRSVTWSEGPAFTITPFTREASIPPVTPSQAIVIALVIVTAPKPPGSRQLISPSVAVFEIAPANVLQGAVRLHGLASSPTPETQVRVACACADPVCSESANIAPSMVHGNATFFILSSLVDLASELSVVLRGARQSCGDYRLKCFRSTCPHEHPSNLTFLGRDQPEAGSARGRTDFWVELQR